MKSLENVMVNDEVVMHHASRRTIYNVTKINKNKIYVGNMEFSTKTGKALGITGQEKPYITVYGYEVISNEEQLINGVAELQ